MNEKEVIARRVARELKDGDRVNLGIGLPTLVAQYLPPSLHVFFHSENGIMGMSPLPGEGFEDINLTDAGGRPVGAMPGACAFDSAFSFGIIRGGHLDVTVLGGLEVDETGQLANWMVPGAMVPGMGGAMDLVTGARRVIVAMTHRSRTGSKIVPTLQVADHFDTTGRSRGDRACSDPSHGAGTSAPGNRTRRVGAASATGDGSDTGPRTKPRRMNHRYQST